MACVLAVSLPQFHVVMAATAQPARVGCLRCLYLRNNIAGLLVLRPDSRFCQHAGQRSSFMAAESLRYSCAGMAQLSHSLAPLSEGISIIGWSGDPARPFGSHRS